MECPLYRSSSSWTRLSSYEIDPRNEFPITDEIHLLAPNLDIVNSEVGKAEETEVADTVMEVDSDFIFKLTLIFPGTSAL